MTKISDAEFARARVEDARRRARRSLESITDDEDAPLTAAAEGDPDNLPAADLMRRRGRPPLASPKRAIKLRLDADVIARFKADGDGWQTRMNDALRKEAGLD